MKYSVKFNFVLFCLNFEYQFGICENFKYHDLWSVSNTTIYVSVGVTLFCVVCMCTACCACCCRLCRKRGHTIHYRRPAVQVTHQSRRTSRQQAARFDLQNNETLSEVRSVQESDGGDMQTLVQVEIVSAPLETR